MIIYDEKKSITFKHLKITYRSNTFNEKKICFIICSTSTNMQTLSL